MKNIYFLFIIIVFTSCLHGSDAENTEAPIDIEVKRTGMDSVKKENDSLKASLRRSGTGEEYIFQKL